MITFIIRPIEEIRGKIKLFKLMMNGFVPYNAFEDQIRQNGNLGKELNTIQTEWNKSGIKIIQSC